MLDFEEYRKRHPNFNWQEAEEITPEDLDAAASFFDALIAEIRQGKRDMQVRKLSDDLP